MSSTFSALEIGKRGIMAHERALGVTGHNLTNAETEGYSRQRIELGAMEPIYVPGLNREETPGQIGQGVVIDRISRVRNELLDSQIVARGAGEGYWQARDPYIRQLDQIYLEVGDNSIRAKMDAFWDSWQELANHPSDMAPRTAVLERGKTLVDGIHGRFSSLKGLQDMANQDIEQTVRRVNELSKQIAGMNASIQKSKAQGDNPNDLYDRRDLLVDKLSGILPITVDHRDPDEFMIHIDGMVFVQGNIGRQFEITMPNGDGVSADGYGTISWADTGDEFQWGDHVDGVIGRGSLAALVEMRDITIESEIQVLDNFSMNFIDLVNENHRAGFGVNGKTGIDFFTEHHFTTNVMGNFDRNSDGVADSSYIFRANGVNKLEPYAQIGLQGVLRLPGANDRDAADMIDVPYWPEDTVMDVISRMNNSGAEIGVRINNDGFLSIKGTPSLHSENPDFVLRHLEDSGRFLSGYAGVIEPGTVYDWNAADAGAVFTAGAAGFSTSPVTHPSGWIEVNNVLLTDKASVASGYGINNDPANPGNGDAALAIAAIRNTPVMVGTLGTFDDYFADSVGRIGMLGEQSGRALETANLVMKNLRDMRSSESGVNMDEELSNMIKYQHGYGASARFISTMNTIYETLIRLGA